MASLELEIAYSEVIKQLECLNRQANMCGDLQSVYTLQQVSQLQGLFLHCAVMNQGKADYDHPPTELSNLHTPIFNKEDPRGK